MISEQMGATPVSLEKGMPASEEISEQELKDRILLAHTVLQMFYWNLDYRNTHQNVQEVPESEISGKLLDEKHSQEFRNWYTSKQGMDDIASYARTHTQDAIGEQEDMHTLVRSFVAFKNRSLH